MAKREFFPVNVGTDVDEGLIKQSRMLDSASFPEMVLWAQTTRQPMLRRL